MSRYDESISKLKSALQFGIEASLEGFTAFMHYLGDPHSRYPSLQVGGTNGKTSTSRYTAAILRACGVYTGLYTSPELMEYPERMELGGQPISHERFADVILGTIEQAEAAIAAGVIEYITEFEILTAAAFTLFAEAEVQFAVLEVGLGGMWDATSIVTPKVAVVTGIDLEHTAILGDTVEEIAVQKAAIIKPGSYAVLGPGVEETRRIFYDRCREVGAEYTIIQPPYVQFDYIGPDYQSINIATAWVAAERALGQAIEPETVQQALDGLVIPGRFEILRDEPFLMIDAAHNPQATRYLCEALVKRYGLIPDENGIDRVPGIDTLLLGILNDKDTRGIIEPLTKLFKNVAVTKSASPRSIPVDELAELVETIDGRRPARYETIAEALADLTVRGVATLATGSITVAGETKAVFTGLL